MNEVTIFNYGQNEVRTVIGKDGEPWFVAKDVCSILEIGNVSMALNRLDYDEKGISTIDTLGGGQSMLVISESGLYELIFNSRKPEARAFKKWVKTEVLPSIRKTGSYSMRNQSPTNELRYAFEDCKAIAEIAGLAGNMAVIAADQAVKRLTGRSPLELIGHTHLISETQERALTPTEIGQELGGMSAIAVNKLLAAKGLQRKIGKYWEPVDDGSKYAILMDTGKKHGNGTPVQQLKWNRSIIDILK